MEEYQLPVYSRFCIPDIAIRNFILVCFEINREVWKSKSFQIRLQDMWKHLNCTCCKRHLHRRGKLLASSPQTCHLRELKKILCWNGLSCQCQCRQNIRDFLVIVFSHKFLFLKNTSMPLVYSYEYDNEVHIVNNMPEWCLFIRLWKPFLWLGTDESETLQQWIPSLEMKAALKASMMRSLDEFGTHILQKIILPLELLWIVDSHLNPNGIEGMLFVSHSK